MITIGIDIDGTLTVPDFWVQPMNRYFKTDFTPGDSQEYDWLKVYDIGREEFDRFYRTHGPDMHYRAEIRPDVADTVRGWAQTYNVYYLTARQEWLTDTTRAWLAKYQLPGEAYVLGSHNKLPKARELGCSIFVEDNYDVACQLADGGIDVILLDCPYNRKPLPERVTRVHDWQDVAREVNRIAGE